jgi:hypothetical protein
MNFKTIKKVHAGNINAICLQLYDVYPKEGNTAIIETRMMNKDIEVTFDFDEELATIHIEGCHTGGNMFYRADIDRVVPICDKAPRFLYNKLTTFPNTTHPDYDMN